MPCSEPHSHPSVFPQSSLSPLSVPTCFSGGATVSFGQGSSGLTLPFLPFILQPTPPLYIPALQVSTVFLAIFFLGSPVSGCPLVLQAPMANPTPPTSGQLIQEAAIFWLPRTPSLLSPHAHTLRSAAASQGPSQIGLYIGQLMSLLSLWIQQHVGDTRVLPGLPYPAWSPISHCSPELRWLCLALLGTCHICLVSMVMSVSHANCLWRDYKLIISHVGLSLRLLLLKILMPWRALDPFIIR